MTKNAKGNDVMPSYISHAIHSEELYKNLVDENLLKEDIKIYRLRGYSIAYDYAFLVPNVDNHNYSAKDYLLYLITYIKMNHLQGDPDVMAYLYGHISHFYLDAFTHPLIYYIEKGCMPSSFLPSHFMVEGYLNSYLSEKILDKDIMDVKATYFNDVDLKHPEIKKIIHDSYKKIYNKNNVMPSFYAIRNLFNMIESVYKNTFKTMDVAKGLTNFDFFLQRNKLSTSEMANEDNNAWLNPVTGMIHHESFLELFYQSIDSSLEAIKEINDYLYNNGDFSKVMKAIPDLSLETGLPKSKGFKMLYKRRG